MYMYNVHNNNMRLYVYCNEIVTISYRILVQGIASMETHYHCTGYYDTRFNIKIIHDAEEGKLGLEGVGNPRATPTLCETIHMYAQDELTCTIIIITQQRTTSIYANLLGGNVSYFYLEITCLFSANSVVVHGSGSRDATLQITSLAQVLLDARCRTMKG